MVVAAVVVAAVVVVVVVVASRGWGSSIPKCEAPSASTDWMGSGRIPVAAAPPVAARATAVPNKILAVSPESAPRNRRRRRRPSFAAVGSLWSARAAADAAAATCREATRSGTVSSKSEVRMRAASVKGRICRYPAGQNCFDVVLADTPIHVVVSLDNLVTAGIAHRGTPSCSIILRRASSPRRCRAFTAPVFLPIASAISGTVSPPTMRRSKTSCCAGASRPISSCTRSVPIEVRADSAVASPGTGALSSISATDSKGRRRAAPPLVEQPVVGDREHPGAEVVFGT